MKRLFLAVFATVAIIGCSSKEAKQDSNPSFAPSESASSAPAADYSAPAVEETKPAKKKKGYKMSDYEK